MKGIWVWVALVGLCGVAQAQTTSSRAQPQSRPPVVWVAPAQDKLEPITLQEVSIDIRIEGFIASTTMDLTFANPNGRVLEGEFVFPLADGQTITGYALEVAGKLRQGVVVEKETARVAFESTERRGIDPGLAELTRGNVFRTRLYPIPARGTKRVAVSFDQPLIDAGTTYRYVLPLQFTGQVHHFKVHAEAVRGEHRAMPPSPHGIGLEQWHDNLVADLDRKDFQPDRELAFAIDKPASAVTAFAVPHRLEPEWRTFAAQVQTASPAHTNTTAVKRIALYYDASGSANSRDRARELDFLGVWLSRLRDVDVELTAFRNDADPAETFHVRNGDSGALRKAIEALPLDGGSSYGAIRINPTAKPDVIVVFGDGLSNFGLRDPQITLADGSKPRLLFVHAAQMADVTSLARLARRSGGQVVNLLQSTQDEALAATLAGPLMLEAVTVTRGECVDLVPSVRRPVAATMSLYGRCRGSAEIELRFSDDMGTSTRHTVRVDDGTVLDPDHGAFVLRLWAAARISDLQDAATADETTITMLAKRYGVVTHNTSMLVLDRIEDYVRYGVEPREPDLLAEYEHVVAMHAKSVAPPVQVHMDQVLKQWTEFRNWHEARHPWLESVLAPAAQAEIERWQALTAVKGSRDGVDKAKDLSKRSNALKERWLRDGADASRRRDWEHEATSVMLRLDALRQRRLSVAPESDVVAKEAQTGARGRYTVSSYDRAMPAPPPPAPPPPTPEASQSATMLTAEATTTTASPMRELAVAKSEGPAAPVISEAKIKLQEWSPNSAYLASLRSAHDPYEAYLHERQSQAQTPSFFLDCADYFRREVKNPRLALRILSNLAEIDVDNAALLRVLAYRLQQWERFDLAVPLFEEALRLRGEEPQSYRDLALALTRQPAPDFARAVDLLWHVVERTWDSRFPEIETIALHELNDALARAPADNRSALLARLDTKGVDHRLVDDSVPVELRVVLTWDADDTDIDLWVIDPTGEIAIYNHPRTTIGGQMSRDFTGGYGPEVFTIRRPIPGTYTVKANYYGSRQQKLTGDVTVQVEFLTHFGSGSGKREAITRRLENKKDLIEIGSFLVDEK